MTASFRKSGGGGTTTFEADLSGGVVEVLSGTLSLAAAGQTTDEGDFSVSGGATLDLTGGTNRTYTGHYTGTGAGTVHLSSGNLQVGSAGATFNFPGEMFQWTGGDLSGSGTLTNAGTLIVDGASLRQLTANVDNAGTVIVRGTTGIRSGNSTIFNNLAGGLLDFQSDAPFDWAFGGFPVFNNQGTLRKSGGSGTTLFEAIFSGGVVEVLSGTLSLGASSSTTNGGDFTVAGGATLDLTGGTPRTYTGLFSGDGDGTISLGSGNLQIGASGATFDFGGELFQWTGGDLSGSGTLTNSGTLVIDGDALHTLTAPISNTGTVIVRGTSGIRSGNGTVFDNLASGTFRVEGNGPYDWAFGGRPIFNNAGTFIKAAPAGTGAFPGAMPFEANLTSTGLIAVQIGTLSLDWNGISSGIIDIATDQTLDVNSIFENAAGGIIQGNGTFDTCDGSFTNNGTIAPTVIMPC